MFPLEPHDAVRTRLTHSLEVSSIARGLATRSAKWLVAEGHIEAGMDRWIEAIAAACGLIHDLGNPIRESMGELDHDAQRRPGREPRRHDTNISMQLRPNAACDWPNEIRHSRSVQGSTTSHHAIGAGRCEARGWRWAYFSQPIFAD